MRIARQGKHFVMTKGTNVVTIPRHDPVIADTMADIARAAGMPFHFETSERRWRLTAGTRYSSLEARALTAARMGEGAITVMSRLDELPMERRPHGELDRAAAKGKEHHMKSITTYLHFNGDCRTAMAFYLECFGGELELMAYPDAAGEPDPDPKARVMHGKIAKGGQALLMASDCPPGSEQSSPVNGFSVFVDCSTRGELEELFVALSRDGKVTVPPSEMPFGCFGMCDDPFGISWILHCAKAE